MVYRDIGDKSRETEVSVGKLAYYQFMLGAAFAPINKDV
jgi:hypothetical protein